MSGAEKFSRSTGPTLFDTATCEKSEGITSRESRSSAEDSPAKTSATLAKELASRVLEAAFGSSTHELLASYDQASSSWRTSQRSLLVGSIECLVTLPHSGTIRSGSLCALPTLGHHTEESASSSWLTPRAFDQHEMTSRLHDGERVVGNRVIRKSGTDFAMGLSLQVNWPTPTSRDWKDGDCRNADVEANGLLGRVALTDQPKGSLNPAWVETLQGFPQGWTVGPQEEAKPSTNGNRPASRATSRNEESGSQRSGTQSSRKSRTRSG